MTVDEDMQPDDLVLTELLRLNVTISGIVTGIMARTRCLYRDELAGTKGRIAGRSTPLPPRAVLHRLRRYIRR